ncbi:hypothetical protein CEXT_686431 [Caerostris extrusa]|uniref:Uncharacterized protein n=1 Tax=Caerostris extrusa TaxID=172846 RepID=A0AAV4NI82_CAEEX|nr:hypothetical protein CEXT_686431 [Caerostris extrusa]
MHPSGSSKCASQHPFFMTVRKLETKLEKKNRKKTLLNFLLAEVQPFNGSLFFPLLLQRQKDFNNRCPFRKKCEKLDIELDRKKNPISNGTATEYLPIKKDFDKENKKTQ